MFNLEVNFLKDRQPSVPEKAPRGLISINDKIPLFGGIAAGAIALLGVGGFWWFQLAEQSRLEKELADTNEQLNKLAKEQGTLSEIQNETNQFKQQTQALASVFDQIKPWSALVKDISERVPPGVQISCIAQIPVTSSSSSSSGGCQNVPNPPTSSSSSSSSTSSASGKSSVATDKVEIAGTAQSFNGVNDLLLIVQRSLFFKDAETRLVTAQLIDNPIKLERSPIRQFGTSDNVQLPELPKVVQFKIQTSLSEKTASQLLPELNSLGDLGLTTRIESLKKKGVLK